MMQRQDSTVVSACSQQMTAQARWPYTSVLTARERALLHLAHGSLASMVTHLQVVVLLQCGSHQDAHAEEQLFCLATLPVRPPTCRKCCCSMPASRVPARASIVCLLLSFSCPSCLRAPGLRRVASSGAPSWRRTLAGWAAWYSGPTSCSRLPNSCAKQLAASMSCLQSTGISAALPNCIDWHRSMWLPQKGC